jgi:hypothetical protein
MKYLFVTSLAVQSIHPFLTGQACIVQTVRLPQANQFHPVSRSSKALSGARSGFHKSLFLHYHRWLYACDDGEIRSWRIAGLLIEPSRATRDPALGKCKTEHHSCQAQSLWLSACRAILCSQRDYSRATARASAHVERSGTSDTPATVETLAYAHCLKTQC